MSMNELETKRIVRDAVYETLCGLGITTHDPHEMQADFHYMRKLRKGSEFLSKTMVASVITVTIPTVLYLLWEVVRKGVSGG